MLGCLYGSLVGSIYEYEEYLHHNKDKLIKASEKSNIILPESFITKDGIMALSIAESVLLGIDYEESMRKYILNNINSNLFPKRMIDWAYGIGIYNSNKNDCLARLSPLPNSIDSYLLLTNEVIKLTSKTHNNACALLSSLCIAQMIFLGNNSYSRDEIKKIVDDFYQFDYQFNLNDLRENMHYDEEIKTTIGVVLYSIFNTDNFDDAIRLCLSIGGDTDTNCAIVGSIAESLYGMNETQINDVYNHLNDDYKKLLICKKYVN